MNNRIVTPNGTPAVPQIDGVQLGCAMLVQGRGEHLPPREQAIDIAQRIEALMNEFARIGQEQQRREQLRNGH
jgi:hypothetical protein